MTRSGAAGLHLGFLPGDSPDCNRIERAFTALRRREPRFFDAVIATIGYVLRTLTAIAAHGFFAAAGFPRAWHDFRDAFYNVVQKLCRSHDGRWCRPDRRRELGR